MKRLSHYLYKYPHSKNFYFRVRIPNQIIKLFSLENQFFIGSLNTSDLNVAQRLALLIKPLLFRESSMWDYSEAMDMVREIREAQAKEDMQGEKWDFRNYLKERFKQYLSWGKQAIAAEMSVTESLDELPEINPKDISTFQEYLQSNISPQGFNGNTELLAQKGYLLSFLDDYAAFTRTNEFRRAKQPSDSQLSLTQATAAEKLFSEFGYGESYVKAFPLEVYTDEPDGEALARFVARHLNLEFSFKQSLAKQLKEYKQSFDCFSEEAFDRESLSPTHMQSFSEMFATLQETLSTIKDFKEEQMAKKEAEEAVRLSEMAKFFMVEKAKSAQADTVRQYEIAFEYLYSLIGEDCNILNFGREQAVEIKKSLLSKYANGEKGRKQETISVATLNKYLSNYGAFFNWCYQHKKINQGNQFTKLSIKETDKNTASRRSYTQSEINKIMAYEPLKKSEAKTIRDDIYWFPKVALYTGMRLNEIAALTVDDFQIVKGIHFINLTDKKLKTESSRRVVPVHSKLIELGLIKFVEEKRNKGEEIVFSQIRVGKTEKKRDGWAEPISRWFNRTALRNMGVDKDQEAQQGIMIDFHSFRTTFISRLKFKGCDGYMVKQVVGHMKSDNVTFERYGKNTSTHMDALKELVEEIDY
ncbi:site-specific integrase [Thalassotalea euphylliae]|uniref:Site-specific integrase n=1 Tax=Thalassotalea euphylliae TaxID=1655234 RepID=A0A3E0UG94_9GAMM|nr:site-specific integrase [Thalassotalea euphylliae]REL35886.1 site-specific integrase [Thalassotalea euphylliae]